jgi:MFS family permease
MRIITAVRHIADDQMVVDVLATPLGSVGGPMWGIAATSLQQRAVPDELRGRVSAVYRFIGFGGLALAALLGGLLGESLGLRSVFVIATALTLLTLIPFARIVTNRVLS